MQNHQVKNVDINKMESKKYSSRFDNFTWLSSKLKEKYKLGQRHFRLKTYLSSFGLPLDVSKLISELISLIPNAIKVLFLPL